MRIRLNGEPTDVDGPLTVAELLVRLDLGEAPVAVARNREVVRRGEQERVEVREGDEIEVIRAVAGG
jgi:sulfur carrier protein